MTPGKSRRTGFRLGDKDGALTCHQINLHNSVAAMVNLNYFLNKNYNKLKNDSKSPMSSGYGTRSNSQLPLRGINTLPFQSPSFIPYQADIIICQEPYYVAFGRVAHLELTKHHLFKGGANTKVRASVIINKKIKPWKLTQFCDADQTVVCFKLNSKPH